jgi:hypothetical protein
MVGVRRRRVYLLHMDSLGLVAHASIMVLSGSIGTCSAIDSLVLIIYFSARVLGVHALDASRPELHVCPLSETEELHTVPASMGEVCGWLKIHNRYKNTF